jgi:hypothetical protein
MRMHGLGFSARQTGLVQSVELAMLGLVGSGQSGERVTALNVAILLQPYHVKRTVLSGLKPVL